MASNYSYTETEHLEHQSFFHNFQFDKNLPDHKNLLEAIKLWEEEADAKYDDILGYGCLRLRGAASPKAWAEIEVNNVDKLLNTGSCELLAKYPVCGDYGLDLEQIPKAYKFLLINGGINFISNSLEATKKYLDSEQDDLFINCYFPRTWVVASQVQALIWYKEFLLDVVRNGISFREDEKSQITIENIIGYENILVSSKQIKLIFNKIKPGQWRGHFSREKENKLDKARIGEKGDPIYSLTKVSAWLAHEGHYTIGDIKTAINIYNGTAQESAITPKAKAPNNCTVANLALRQLEK
jgi:hypothetical protein